MELDFLETGHPTIPGLPSYARQEPNSTAYRVAIYDARAGFPEGQIYVQQFGVDEAIPARELPLGEGDSFTADFQAGYDGAFYSGLWGILPEAPIDYTQQPPGMESTYAPSDQARTRARMAAVQAAAQRGVDLDSLSAPLPIETR